MSNEIKENLRDISNLLSLEINTNGEKEFTEEEINKFITELCGTSLQFYDLCYNEETLFNEINNFDSQKLEELLKIYSEDKCVSKGINNSVQTARYIILKARNSNETINTDFINKIKDLIDGGKQSEISKYFGDKKVLSTIVKRNTTGFGNWKTPYNICYRFFFQNGEKELVENKLEAIYKKLIFDLQLADTEKKIVNFNGTRNYGSDRTTLIIYPSELEDYKYAYQLCVQFINGTCKVGLYKGSDCKGDCEVSDADWVVCVNYKEISSEVGKLLFKYNDLNNDLLNGKSIQVDDNLIDLYDSFEEWLFTQVNNPKSKIKEDSTIETYLKALKNIVYYKNGVEYPVYSCENEKIINSLYKEEYEKERSKSGHNKISSALKNYEYFLIERKGINKIYYGVPGCGKSYYVEHDVTRNIKEENKFRTTFYLDYTNSDFVGQIVPVVTKENVNGNVTSEVKYESIAGPFTEALAKAYSTTSKVVLIIEEINRGNAAAIFGDLFQLLDRLKINSDKDARVAGDSEYPINNNFITKYLEDNNIKIPKGLNKIYIPNNLTIIATMNTSDQNVFPLDTAFKRRWQRERVISKWDNTNGIKNMHIPGTDKTWEEFAKGVNATILSNVESSYVTEDKCLGSFFASENMLIDGSEDEQVKKNKLESFVNNVIDYLYNDVTKFNHAILFNDQVTNYESMYRDILSFSFGNGEELDLKKWFNSQTIEAIEKAETWKANKE